jgi:glycine cleavage system H protein
MRIPADLLYSSEHLWARKVTEDLWEAGVTDYAQELLGDVVFIQPPVVGSTLIAHHPCGLIESVKTGSDLHALVDGEVVEINEQLLNGPELVNDKPYDAWIFKYKPKATGIEADLLNADAYQALINNV